MLILATLACDTAPPTGKGSENGPVPVALELDGGSSSSGTELLIGYPITAGAADCADSVEIWQREQWTFDLHDPTFRTADPLVTSTLTSADGLSWSDSAGVSWTWTGSLTIESWDDGTAIFTMGAGPACNDETGCVDEGGTLTLGPGLTTGLVALEDSAVGDWRDDESGEVLCQGDFTAPRTSGGK